MPLKKAIQRMDPSWRAAGLTWLWVAFLHPDVFFNPNSQLLASSRDAVKNVYTLAWQWAHGAPFSSEFRGMGWPFSEHVFYTDGHPLLAWLTGGWLVPHLIPAEWTAGLLHLLIIASWGAAAAVLVRVMRRLGAEGPGIIWMCSLIPLMHPQMLRWTGHYALAYAVALPLTWLLQLRWLERPTWRNASLQAINLALWLFTHAYLGAIAAAFAGLIGGMASLRRTGRNARQWAQLMWTTLGPLVAYLALLAASDGHPDRTGVPFGFWDNVSRWNAALLPSHGPLGAVRRELGWGLTTWEGWGYLGTGTWVIGVAALIGVTVGEIKRRRPGGAQLVNSFGAIPARLSALAAIVLFAIAVGEPFLSGREVWLEQTKLFMQFRAIGRFTWPAVWVFPLLAARWTSRQSSPNWQWVLVICMVTDVIWMHHEVRNQMAPQSNPFAHANAEIEALQDAAAAHHAVAIHPVPWFQMGSESIGRAGTVEAHRNALAASFHTGLPTTATHLTRMSISEARTLVEWMGLPELPTELTRACSPLDPGAQLLVYACDDSTKWADDDWRMWRQARRTQHPQIRTIDLKSFLMDRPAPDPTRVNATPADWRWKGLNQHPFAAALEGGGVVWDRQVNYLIVDTVRPDSLWLETPVEASCWFWHGTAHSGRDALQFEWVAEAEWSDGRREWLKHLPVASSGDHVFQWTRASITLDLDSIPERIFLFAVGFGAERDSIIADAYRLTPVIDLPPGIPLDNSPEPVNPP